MRSEGEVSPPSPSCSSPPRRCVPTRRRRRAAARSYAIEDVAAKAHARLPRDYNAAAKHSSAGTTATIRR
jgi:hypothetical protein